MTIHSSITIFHKDIHEFINTDFEIEILYSGCAFSEGPVWSSEGYYLFSDIPENVIYKLQQNKKPEIYLQQSGSVNSRTQHLSEQIGSNGLAFDSKGHLFICQHGEGAIAKYDGEKMQPFITTYNDKSFNSPNDLIIHPNGQIFFTDPPYGLKDQKINAEEYQPTAGIYCWQSNEIKLITDRYQFPNGVCLSPDQKSLFTCSNKSFEAFVLEFDTETLQLKRQVCNENSDGIKCDRFGNLYLCSKDGIVIIDASGKRLALISLLTIPANCCWGGENLNDLFITARENIFLIRNLQKL